MEQTNRSPRIMRFGVCEADIEPGELRKHGLRLKLCEQSFQILAMLLARPGEVVSREFLRERLWPSNTFVDFDHGLNNAVMKLREALGDSSERPRFIETLPRRGYRFIAPVEQRSRDLEAPVADGAAAATLRAIATPRDAVEPATASSSALPKGIEGLRKNYFALPRIAVLVAGVLVGSALISGITMHYFRGVNASKGKANRSSSLVVLPL